MKGFWGPQNQANNAKTATGKQQTRTSTRKPPKQTCEHTRCKTSISHVAGAKENKKNADKTQNARKMLYQHQDEHEAMRGGQKKRHNAKTTQQKTRSRKEQRKQEHYLCSETRKKSANNTGKRANTRFLCIQMKNTCATNRKHPKYRQED